MQISRQTIVYSAELQVQQDWCHTGKDQGCGKSERSAHALAEWSVDRALEVRLSTKQLHVLGGAKFRGLHRQLQGWGPGLFQWMHCLSVSCIDRQTVSIVSYSTVHHSWNSRHTLWNVTNSDHVLWLRASDKISTLIVRKTEPASYRRRGQLLMQ